MLHIHKLVQGQHVYCISHCITLIRCLFQPMNKHATGMLSSKQLLYDTALASWTKNVLECNGIERLNPMHSMNCAGTFLK